MGAVVGALALATVHHFSWYGRIALFAVGIVFGLVLGDVFGARERDVALPMPYATAVAAFVGAFLLPLFAVAIVLVLWVAASRVGR